jgi:hypothetical protein
MLDIWMWQCPGLKPAKPLLWKTAHADDLDGLLLTLSWPDSTWCWRQSLHLTRIGTMHPIWDCPRSLNDQFHSTHFLKWS